MLITMIGDTESIEVSIKTYLLRYKAYTKYLEKITIACTLSNINAVPSMNRGLVSKQRELVEQINNLDYQIRDLFSTKRDMNKMEKMHDKITSRRRELLDITREIEMIEHEGDNEASCEEEVSAIKGEVAADYKALMSYLLDARRSNPAVFEKMERDTGVFLFPQTSLSRS